MFQITRAQWDALGDSQGARFRRRLVGFLEQHFGPTDPASPFRTPDEAVGAAIDFQRHLGELSELQLARLAVVLLTVNRCAVPPQGVDEVRRRLAQPGASSDERLDAAAAYLGLLS
ncbi:MAG TPA: hypothetical protein VF457_04045 [Burkholderiaceae bacterium]